MINWLQYVIHWIWAIFEMICLVILFIAVSTIQIIFHKYTGLRKYLKTGKETHRNLWVNTTGTNEKYGKWIIFVFFNLWPLFLVGPWIIDALPFLLKNFYLWLIPLRKKRRRNEENFYRLHRIFVHYKLEAIGGLFPSFRRRIIFFFYRTVKWSLVPLLP